jgi:Spy/CpxP family protein refolding chaperone
VLESADQLALSDDVRKAVQDVFDGMNAEARRLGSDYVDAEQALDRLFASGSAGAAKIDELTARAADLRARLRAVHLKAHLEVLPLLSRHQRMIYAQIRGYGNDGHNGHGGHGSHQ